MDRRKLLLVVAVIVALLGAGLVFLYVQGADKRAAEQYESVEVLVATAPIMTGETIESATENGKLQLASVPMSAALTGALDKVESLRGLVANTNIYVGEQIVPEKFGGVGETAVLPIEDDLMAVSVQLSDPARVAGFVNAGSEVAIWLTGDLSAGGNEGESGPFTRLVIPSVKVLAAGSTTLVQTTSTDDEGAQTTEQMPRTLLTLAVDQDQAEKIKLAESVGELSFGLKTSSSKVSPGQGRTFDNLFN